MRLLSSSGVPVKVADDRAEYFISRHGYRRPGSTVPAPVPTEEKPAEVPAPKRRRRTTTKEVVGDGLRDGGDDRRPTGP